MNKTTALRVLQGLWEPVRATKLAHIPFLAVYFAYGLTGITAIAGMFWVKKVLQFSASDLALAAFWAGVPWTLKMLFGQFVDVRPIFGSPRRVYIFIGSALVALGYLLFAGLAGNWPAVTGIASPLAVYFLASVVIATGLVMQDVTADAMTSEVNTGDERDARTIQVLGRIALAAGSVVAAFFAGIVGDTSLFSYESAFLVGCGIPVISAAGALFWKQKAVPRAVWNYPILVGGLGFAAFVVLVNMTDLPAKAEIVFAGNVLAISAFLYVLGRTLERKEAMMLLATGLVVFVFRAMPSAGAGVSWWEIEVLGFDEQFFSRLQLTGAVLGLLGLLFVARSIRNYSVTPVLVFVTVVNTLLALPIIGMYYGLHEWTEEHFGFGARTIALVDTAVGSPFGAIAMVPMLALIAVISQRGNPATWFALSASFMNLPIATADLLTKWFNQIWVVTQAQEDAAGVILVPGDFSNLGILMILTTAMGFVLPLLMIFAFRKYLAVKPAVPS